MKPWPANWKLRGIIATSSSGAMHLSDNMPERGPSMNGGLSDFRQLLAEFAASETLPCDGVVYLWGLDAPSIDGLTLDKAEERQRDDVPRSDGNLAGPCRNAVGKPGRQAALVCDGKYTKYGKPGPAG